MGKREEGKEWVRAEKKEEGGKVKRVENVWNKQEGNRKEEKK